MLGTVALMAGGLATSAAEIRWTAPPACPSAATVQRRLAELAGDDPITNEVTAVATVQPHGHRWRLTLALRDGERASTRQMDADDCATLADAVALVVATFAQPIAVAATVEDRARSSAPSWEVQPATTEVPSPPANAPPSRGPEPQPSTSRATSAPEPRSRPPAWWGLRAGAVAGRALQRDLDVGPELTVSWQRGLLRLAGQASFLVPRRSLVPDRNGVQLRQWSVAAGLRAGIAVPIARRLALPLSIGAETGPVVARGEGIARPRTAVSPWVAAVGSAQLVWRPTPHWGLWAGAAMVVGVVLPRFTVDEAGPLVAGPGGFRASVGLERRWGFGVTMKGAGGH